jgi:DtxR family Mn-dependent transcriptional regulator
METESTENYLIAVYRLTLEASHASTKDIATSLGVSLPSVSQKVARLAEQGYLVHRWHEGAILTEKGRGVALRVLRRHRLIETFLVRMLKYPLDEVHEEAHRLEHAVSDRLTDRLDRLLGYPKVDPHGHPIPTQDGNISVSEYQSLADILPGQTVVVRQVSDLDGERLHYLRKLGLVPGARVSVLEVAPFNGPLSIIINEATVAIARPMARRVMVTSGA